MFLNTDTADKDRETQAKASKGEKAPQGSPSTAQHPFMSHVCLTETGRFETMPLRQRLLCISPLCSSAPRLLSPSSAELHMPQQQLAELAGKAIWKT